MPHNGQDVSAEPANDRSGKPGSDAETGSMREQLDWAHRRTEQLLSESNRRQAEARRLQDRVLDLEQEKRSLAAMLGRAEDLVEGLETGTRALQGSVSLQLGYLITRSLRSPRDLLALPLRMYRVFRDVRSRRRDDSGPAAQAVPLPYNWFPPELQQAVETFHAQMTEAGILRSDQAPGPRGIRASARADGLPQTLSEVRIVSVMDEFSSSAYGACCEVTQLTADAWAGQIEAANPHLLFIESAWDGKDSSWLRQISGASKELHKLVAHCRQKGIPVVFWSKEDPVHFKTFLAAARLADVVFTTDIDCVKHYKNELGHNRVFLLPFATQPLAHNPLERYDRKPGFCFAGSYYLRYPVRQRDFASIIEAVSDVGQVDIYDRNHGKDHPNYRFPESFRKYILGNLSFDQIELAYKGYRFGININTVKNSQSMFARRVFDLLASNTTVVSNYSRGMRLMFGDLVVSGDDSRQLLESLRPMTEDETFRRKHRLLGLRKVLKEHTYQHRLDYVLQKVFCCTPLLLSPEVVVLAKVESAEELSRVLGNFHRQTWPRKRLVICFTAEYRPIQSPVGSDIQVLSRVQALARRVADLSLDGYVAGFHPDDYYGANYLTDLALATGYSPLPAVGKATYYRSREGVPTLESDGAQYRLGGTVVRRRGMARGSTIHASVDDWIDGIASDPLAGEATSIDEFNYCEEGTADSGRWVDDIGDIDQGLSAEALLSIAERIRGGGPVDGEGQPNEHSSTPGLTAAEMFEALGNPGNKYLSTSMDGDLLIESTLPVGQHAYAYLSRTFSPVELGLTDIGRMQLVCERGDGLGLVLVYLDASGQKIAHSLVKSATNITVTVPPGTASVRIGLRASGSGSFRVRRLVFDHVPLPVDTIVTRSRHLLVAKNYPSYDDLYKHAFVHRRVAEYRRSGVDVDVFRTGGDGLSFYEFEGIEVVHGQADHLRAMLRSGDYASVLVHVLDERTWEVLQEFVDSVRIFVWAHGSEMQSASRRSFEPADDAERTRAIAMGERRMQFWRRIFSESHPNLTMVFVSEWSARDIMEDVGVALDSERYRVIHNFVDGDLFAYLPKPAAQRVRILSIRPFASKVYANDLTVAAILELSRRPFFGELDIRIIGDGPLFETTVEPLGAFDNVAIEQRFLTQAEISALHREYGVFLVPTRMDSQGVSRDEAMASGLVPVTNRVAAIPEFVDASCGLLADAEDAVGLADHLERLYRDPDLFSRLSAAAAARVRGQSGHASTVAREVALFHRQPAEA